MPGAPVARGKRGQQWHEVAQRNQRNSERQRTRIGATGVIDLSTHDAGVVPADPVPERETQSCTERRPADRLRITESDPRRVRHVRQREERKQTETQQHQHTDHHRHLTHRHRTAKVEQCRNPDHQQGDKNDPAVREVRHERAEVLHDDGRIERHLDQGVEPSAPGVHKSPAIAERTLHPAVVSAFYRQHARELADQQRFGHSPKNRDGDQRCECEHRSDVRHQRLERECSTGDGEVEHEHKTEQTQARSGLGDRPALRCRRHRVYRDATIECCASIQLVW